jgi:hypothetical protein
MLTSDCGEATLAINPLDRPVFFREFLKMLNVGLDPTYDVDLIQDLCRSFNIEESSVLARLTIYYNTSPSVH